MYILLKIFMHIITPQLFGCKKITSINNNKYEIKRHKQQLAMFHLQIDSSVKTRFISDGSTASAELPSFSAPSSTAVTTESPKLPQRLTLLCLNGLELSISPHAVHVTIELLASWFERFWRKRKPNRRFLEYGCSSPAQFRLFFR